MGFWTQVSIWWFLTFTVLLYHATVCGSQAYRVQDIVAFVLQASMSFYCFSKPQANICKGFLNADVY